MGGDLLLACWSEARRLVDHKWPSIVRVAQVLLQRRSGRLVEVQVEAIWCTTPAALSQTSLRNASL